MAGLLVGNQVGIFGFAWLAVRFGLARLPDGVTWRQIHAVSALTGIGFAMALVAGLVLPWRATKAPAKA